MSLAAFVLRRILWAIPVLLLVMLLDGWLLYRFFSVIADQPETSSEPRLAVQPD